jgi:hypothetical protein
MSRLDPLVRNALASGAAFALAENFIFQSYFDSTLLEKALVPNNLNGNGIASSTLVKRPVSGVGILLLPMSQTPVAVLPVSASGNAATQSAVVLKPGEVYYPGTAFTALEYGVPYGWLGGGVAYIVVLKDMLGDVSAAGSPEIIVQRQRMLIQAGNYDPATLPENWPARFPWLSAVNANAQAQQGAPFLAPSFTRTSFRLRIASLQAQGTVRLIVSGSEDFDQGYTAAGAATSYDAATTSGTFYDIAFQSFTASGAQVGGVALAEFPIQVLDKYSSLPGGDSASALLVDLAANVAGTYVDVVRYGTLS